MHLLFSIDADTKIFVFDIESNSSMVDSSMIPMEQLRKIEKFRDARDRIKRSVARIFLFNYCKRHYGLEDFSFEYTNNQRPRFKSSTLDFSISYSRDMVAIAISTKGIVGLDIEYMDSSLVTRDIAEEFMSSVELETFADLEKDAMKRYFYEQWTSKESFLKANGDGLYIDPKSIINDLGKTIYWQDYVINIFII